MPSNAESPRQAMSVQYRPNKRFDPARDRHPDTLERARIVGRAHQDFMAGRIDVERLHAIRKANGVDYAAAFKALARNSIRVERERYREQHPVKSRVLRWLGLEGLV